MRLDGWEGRLYALIEAAREQPYELGRHDCFRLACRVVEALTGADRWPEFEGYTTERQALARLAAYGSSFEAAGDRFFQSTRLHTARAQRGDICAYADPAGQKHLGVCLGARTAVLGPLGLAYVRTRDCLCAWRVG